MNLHENKNSRKIEVCFSPALLQGISLSGKIVVVIDVFRASSAICTAIEYGVKEIIPVMEIEEAMEYKRNGFITAAERKGEIVEGFEFGNSPYAFMDEALRDKTVVLTTSNCTRAILQAENAKQVLIGSFINITALTDYLLSCEEDVLLLCAGWKNRYNLEDSVVAGAMVERLVPALFPDCDAAIASLHLYQQGKDNLRKYLSNSSHSRRLKHLEIDDDIDFCLKADMGTAIPIFNGKSIVALKRDN